MSVVEGDWFKVGTMKIMGRFLFKSAENAGFIVEIFTDRKNAGSNDTIKAMQGLREQAMAKVNVSEGEGILK